MIRCCSASRIFCSRILRSVSLWKLISSGQLLDIVSLHDILLSHRLLVLHRLCRGLFEKSREVKRVACKRRYFTLEHGCICDVDHNQQVALCSASSSLFVEAADLERLPRLSQQADVC